MLKHPLDARAQELHWLISDAQHTRPVPVTLVPQMRELAGLYERCAKRRFEAEESLAWSDVFAAVTWWINAGDFDESDRVNAEARERAKSLNPEECADVIDELDRLRAWAR